MLVTAPHPGDPPRAGAVGSGKLSAHGGAGSLLPAGGLGDHRVDPDEVDDADYLALADAQIELVLECGEDAERLQRIRVVVPP